MKSYSYFILIILALMMFNCNRAVNVTGNERSEVLEYADPTTDNILAAFNNDDYENFSRDFNERMKNSLTDKVFKQTRDMILNKIGEFKSKELDSVQKQDSHYIVIYKGKFDNEENVEIKVVFTKYVDKNLVSGLWFNSPKLRN